MKQSTIIIIASISAVVAIAGAVFYYKYKSNAQESNTFNW
ncbi:MAG: hypothetical protein RLZZ175_3369 [Bacteroidota bacterium]|jgi:hypothetical protein